MAPQWWGSDFRQGKVLCWAGPSGAVLCGAVGIDLLRFWQRPHQVHARSQRPHQWAMPTCQRPHQVNTHSLKENVDNGQRHQGGLQWLPGGAGSLTKFTALDKVLGQWNQFRIFAGGPLMGGHVPGALRCPWTGEPPGGYMACPGADSDSKVPTSSELQ